MAASANKAKGEDVPIGEKSDNARKGDDGDIKQVKFSGKKTKNSEMVSLEIDLTDPADLIKKLEMVDLTEEESDDLLQRALEVNRLLKAELKRQNAQGGLGSRQSTMIQVSAPASATSVKSRKGSSTRSSKPLPPLRNTSASSQVSQSSHGGLARFSGQSKNRGSERSSAHGPSYKYHSSNPQGVYGAKTPGSASSTKSSVSKSQSGKRKGQVVWHKK